VAEVRGSLARPPAQPVPPVESKPAPAEAKPEAAQAKPAPAEVKPPAAEAKPQPAEARSKFFAELVGAWARAWTLKDQEAYFAFYHPDFRYGAKNMNLDAFKVYRSELMNGSGRLEVLASDFEVRPLGDRVRVAFRQVYRSDQLRDQGRKTLVFKKAGPDWKILSEIWRAD
jgi:ketosteroid isomerase-like protein